MVLIDKETVYKELSEYYHHTAFIQHLCLAEELDRVPVVDAVPVRHGKWRHYERMLTCSECGTVFYDDIMEYFGEEVPRYCPECGARMDL